MVVLINNTDETFLKRLKDLPPFVVLDRQNRTLSVEVDDEDEEDLIDILEAHGLACEQEEEEDPFRFRSQTPRLGFLTAGN